MFIFKRTADIGEKLNKGLKIILVSKFFLISNNKFINKKKKLSTPGCTQWEVKSISVSKSYSMKHILVCLENTKRIVSEKKKILFINCRKGLITFWVQKTILSFVYGFFLNSHIFLASTWAKNTVTLMVGYPFVGFS